MRKAIKQIVIFLLLGLIIISCGPKVDRELKRWDNLTADLKNAALIYPAFAGPFNAQLDIWTKAWPDVQNVEDEKEKAKAMKAFNDEIYKIVGKIDDYKKIQIEINKLPEEISSLLDKNSGKYPELKKYDSRLPIAEQNGIDAINNAVNIIRNAAPKNYDEAYSSFRDAITVLKNGRDDLYKMKGDIDSYVKRQQEAEAEKDK